MSVMDTPDPATPPAGLPRVLDVELPRLRLVRLLEGRWARRAEVS